MEIDALATLDADIQSATTLLNELVTALGAAGSGVPAADQTALETAITNAQAALTAAGTTSATPPVTTTPPATTPPATVPDAPTDVVTSPEVS